MAMMASTRMLTSQAYLKWFELLHTSAQPRLTLLMVATSELSVQMPAILRATAAHRQLRMLMLAIRDKSLNEIKEILENSFLGTYFLYCIWDIEQFPKNTLSALTTYLMQYSGPHYIVILCSSDVGLSSAWHQYTITLPSVLSPQQFAHFCALWHPQVAQLTHNAPLYLNNNQIALNQFAIALPYIPVLGKSLMVLFKERYMPRLMKPDGGSLFAFTDLFWQKNASLFYKQWALLKELYTDQFWIVFWSEQFFRASMYVHCMQHHESQLAQQLAARKLSFMYSKKIWHATDTQLLRTLHNMLYSIDYTSKSGGTATMIEYVYALWFVQ